ncbi:hypothetical protein CEXT_584811 [Caerostris extrusa]|uniref:Uncharacterized protein n=1 Tax=Caerostris extrusa TaxID=172846 RepID=A0AAV4T6L8_CAEEX|nr:hypothetical protein CEXT_584811 [Caerostris extrusa]
MEQRTGYSSNCKEGGGFELEKLGKREIQENWMISLKTYSVGKSFLKRRTLMAPGWLHIEGRMGTNQWHDLGLFFFFFGPPVGYKR